VDKKRLGQIFERISGVTTERGPGLVQLYQPYIVVIVVRNQFGDGPFLRDITIDHFDFLILARV
jgi:hypothetical protein